MNLLGNRSPYSPEMTQLLGLDPAEMRRQAIFRGLQQAGVQLMSSGKLGDAFQGLSEGVNEAKDDYMQQQMLGYKMKQGEEDRAYQNEERAAKQAEREQWNAYVSTLPEDLQPAFMANPGLMGPYITANDSRFQPPQVPKPPQIETIYDEATGLETKVQWNGSDWVPVGGMKAPSGTSLTVNPDGTVNFQQGGMGKPLTEGQSKDTVYVTRALGSAPVLDQYSDALTSLPQSIGGGVPVVGNYAKTEEYQLGENAGREFLQAILRKDTGAAITQDEMFSYGQTYIPQPGDKPALLQQKKQARQRAIAAIQAGLPPQAILQSEMALQKSSGQQPGAPPTGGQTSSGVSWSVE
jgi:hypothetical protein